MATNILENSTLLDMQMRAREELRSISLPGAPDEAWRRVPIQSLSKILKELGEGDIPEVGYSEITLKGPGQLQRLKPEEKVQGAFRSALEFWMSQEEQRVRQRLERANEVEENLAASTNLAFSRDVFLLSLPEGEKEKQTIELELSLSAQSQENASPDIYLPLLIVDAGAHSDFNINVKSMGLNDGQIPVILQLVFLIRENAELSWSFRHMGEGKSPFYVFEKSFQLDHSRFKIGNEAVSSGIRMNDGRYALLGVAAELEHYSLLYPSGQGFSGQKLVVEQYAPHTRSQVETRSVLNDESRSVFIGTVKIPHGAYASEGHEAHRSLLLDPRARVESLPELEIVENDVSCSHASSVTEPDEEDLFYLASRGISQSEARNLLTEAFIEEIRAKMPRIRQEEDNNER